jgi:hypothetical protein
MTKSTRIDQLATAPAAATPQPTAALDTMGYAAYRNRSGSLFIDDPLVRQLQGREAERTIDRMLLDPIIAGSVERTGLTLRSADWTVEPGGDSDLDKRLADQLGEDLDQLETGWKSTVASMADALPWGFSLHEVLYERRSDGFRWVDFSPREQRSVDHWDIDEGTGRVQQVWQRVNLTNRPGLARRSAGPIAIPGWKLLHFRTHPASGRPEGRALIRNAFIPWTDKQELRRILKVGLRRDFTGVAKYQVPAEILSQGATPEQKNALAHAVTLVQEFERDQREGLVVPSETRPGGTESTGYKLELMQSGGRRPMDFVELWWLHNTEIAIGLLAEFALIGTQKVGTQALATVKVGFFERAINAWLDNIAEVMGHKAAATYQIFNPQFAGAKLPKFCHGDVDKRSLDELGTFLQRSSSLLTPDPALEAWIREQAGAPANTIDTTQPADGSPAAAGQDGAASQDATDPGNAAVEPVT